MISTQPTEGRYTVDCLSYKAICRQRPLVFGVDWIPGGHSVHTPSDILLRLTKLAEPSAIEGSLAAVAPQLTVAQYVIGK
jgi:hypothetical protein